MKSFKFYLLLLLLGTSALSPRVGFSQSESHNFTTYDTVINFPTGVWLVRISRDVTPGAPARPAIITQPGQGEMGQGTSNKAPLSAYGPHYWLANGWDGSVVLGNGVHYPILITAVYTSSVNPRTVASADLLDYLLSHYNINPRGVHLAGLSQGAFNWTSMMCLERSPGDQTYAKKVTSLVALSGFATNLVDSVNSPYYWWSKEDTNMYKIWAAKYGGHYFGTEGYNDVTRNTWKGAQAMNDTLPSKKPGYFSYNSVDGGNHGGWNTIYDPSNTDWRTSPSSTVGPYYSASQPPPYGAGGVDVQGGNYNYPENLFQWMLRQGDTTMVSGTTTTTATPPVVSAGSTQTITLPASSASLTGTVTDASGGLTYAWTQVSGPSTAVIGTPDAINTTVSSLQAGTYVFQLSATDAASLSASNTVQVVVNADPGTTIPPTVSAGIAQTITLPTSSVTLTGTATPASGTTIASYAWTQLSGPSATIATPSAASTSITGLTTAGTAVFQLTVTSSAGITATSTVTVTINAASTTSPPPTLPGGLYVKKVITCEYRVWYIASDNKVYTWNNGSATVQQFPIGGRQAVDGAGGFNQFRVLDDQGYIWSSLIDYTTNTVRFDTDSSGNPFDNNVSVYAYGNTTLTIRGDGSVWLFGNDTLHLFHSTGGVNMRPMQLSPAGLQFKKLVIGNRIVGLTNDGQVYEWTYGGGKTPVKKNIPAAAIDIFGSHLDYFGCIIPTTAGGTSGYPYVWGNAPRAWGGTAAATDPVSVKSLWNVVAPITEIAVDWNTTHYIDVNGNMYGFGFNANGEVGNGQESVNQYNYAAPYSWDFNDYEDPVGPPAIQIGAGVRWSKLFSNNFFCFFKYAQDVNDSVYSWGRGKAMVLGNGMSNLQEQYYPNALDVLTPTMVHPLGAIYQTYNWTSPSISAGANQTVTGTSTTLIGTAHAPWLIKATPVANNGIDTAGYHIVSYVWTKVSGGSATITSPNSASTTITGLTPGTYVFNLLTTDNNTGTLSANVTVTVLAPGANAPVANPGSNQTITLPTNSVTLAGSGSEAGGTIAGYAWTQLSGPSTANIGSSSLATTTVSALVQGTYIFQLTVTDATGVTASAPVTVTVNPAAVVAGPPSANAGGDQTITLPVNSVTLSGSGSETGGTIASCAWTQVSGPGTASLGSATSATTTASGLVQGTYTFKLTVKDNSGVTASATVQVTVNAAAPAGAPVANAGGDQTITLPANSVTLSGSGSETGGTIASYAWTQVSGPGTASLGSATSATTTASGLVQGTYTFKLTVKDNSGVTASATVQVTVNAAAPAGTPVANAGGNQTITLPVNSVTLSGSGSETSGTIASYAWTQVSGPGTASLGSATSATTTASGLVQGTYTFKLTVKDNSGVTASATVQVTVNAAAPAGTPVANAGGDQTITLPVNSVTLSGSGSETGGTIASYAWTQVSGPGTASLGSATSATTTASGLVQGTYTFKLTVKDNSGVTASATVQVTVNAHQPPVANAGPNQTTTLTSGVKLDGTASYSPDGTIVSYAWLQLSGPGGVTISNETTATPTLYGLAQGVYVFQLTVTDNAGLSASSWVTITVTANGGGGSDSTSAPGNTAPVAIAGRDTTIYYPGGDTAILNGSASYAPGSTLTSYYWTQVSGPSEVLIDNNTSSVGIVPGGMAPGDYLFQLVVTNRAGDTASARMTVHVKSLERKADNIQMYPNPVMPGQLLTITGSNSYSGLVKFLVMDLRGRVIRTVILDKQAPSFVQTIDVNGLSRGTYILFMQFYLDQRPMAMKFVVD